MKKKFFTLFAIATLGMGYLANAQIQRGHIMVGGDIANFNLGLNEGNQFSMNINPKAAWFIKDNLALGGYLNFGLVTNDPGTSVYYGIGALGRYYINDNSINVLKKSKFFFEGTVGIDGSNPSGGENTNGLGLSFGPGLAYFVTPNIGLEGLFKYNGIIGFGERATTSNLGLNIGLQIYLSGRQAKEAIGQ